MKETGVAEGPASQPMAAYKAESQRGPRRVPVGPGNEIGGPKDGADSGTRSETRQRRWLRSGRRRVCTQRQQRRRRSAPDWQSISRRGPSERAGTQDGARRARAAHVGRSSAARGTGGTMLPALGC
jgi:hypothetical protein